MGAAGRGSARGQRRSSGGASVGMIHMVMQYPEMPTGPEVGTGSPACRILSWVRAMGEG